MMKAALYARISTRDQQSIPMQLDALRDYAGQRNWQIEAEVWETESGKRADRAGREKVMNLARAGKIDVVLVWKLNRWGRSTADLLLTLDEMAAHGVAIVSICELLDLSSPTGRLMVGILAVFAQFEREMMAENCRAGIEAYRKKHSSWGRPATTRKHKDEAKRLKAAGRSIPEICEALKISRASVYRLIGK